MKRKLFIGLFVVFNLILSCKNNTSVENVINLSESLNNKDLVLLSSIANNIEYIKLQSDSTCYIDRIKNIYQNIQFYQNKIFINDNLKLLSFDSAGIFIKKFGEMGRGPSEFQDIKNFTILPNKEKVVIFSSRMQKALFFDFNGNFLNDIKLNFWPLAMTSFNNELIFINPKGYRRNSDYYTLSVISDKGEIQKRLIYRDNEEKIEKKEAIGLATSSNFYIMNNALQYWERVYDTIWSISSDFEVISKRLIYYGKDELPIKYILESNAKKNKEIDRYVKLWNYYETNRYMFFEIGNKTKLNHIYYDKKSKKSYNLQFMMENRIGKYFSFNNDIDGGLPFWPDGIISEDKVFSLIYAYDLKKHINEQKNRIGKSNTIHNEKIQKLINNANLIDNPIIMIVTLKNLK